MNTRLVVIILLLAVLLALVFLSWGLAGANDKNDKKDGTIDPSSALDGLLEAIDGVSPKPSRVFKGDLFEIDTEGRPIPKAQSCLKPAGAGLTVTRPCILSIRGDDGFFATFKLDFRKLTVKADGPTVKMMFKSGSSLAGQPDTIDLPNTAKTKDGKEHKTQEIDLKVPASGGTLTITECADQPCKLTLSNFTNQVPK